VTNNQMLRGATHGVPVNTPARDTVVASGAAEAGAAPAVDPRRIWDERYASLRQRRVPPAFDAWLERWPTAVERAQGGVVLDLGCGGGGDSRWLGEHGCLVCSADFSPEALRGAHQSLPRPRCLRVDLRDGLPLRPSSCRLVVAGLVLHYFSWTETCRMVADIRACLAPEGLLLARVNSLDDVNYGAVGHRQVEPGLFLVEGMEKRFFSQDDVRRLFGCGWDLLDLQPQTIARYGRPKHVLEVLAARSDDD